MKKSTAAETVTLEAPIKRGESEIAQITVRKPLSGELRGLNLVDLLQMDVAALTKLIPRISDPTLTEREVQQMDPADLVECGGAVASFLLKRDKADASPTA